MPLQISKLNDKSKAKKNSIISIDSYKARERELLANAHNGYKRKNRRQKKTDEEIRILENAFQKNPKWSHDDNCNLALLLGYTK